MSPYQQVERVFARNFRLSHLGAIAGWDQAVMMPTGGNEARSQALGELALLQVETIRSPELAEALTKAGANLGQLDDWQRANLREALAAQKRATAVDPEIIERRTATALRCEHLWRELRPKNNWSEFVPHLESLLELVREEGRQRAAASGFPAYEALMDLYEPGLKIFTVEKVFAELRSTLPELTREIIERQKSRQVVQLGRKVPVAKQRAMMKEFMLWVGFDFKHGRLDESHHPFCGGVPEDVRLTTRYSEEDFLSGLLGVLHETGHARYEQGLPREWIAQPVGQARGMALHESQSLFVEMQIGRSLEFWQFAAPILEKHLSEPNDPKGFWEPHNLFLVASKVEPGFIRVDADEVTYPSHIILRFEIERALIEGSLNIRDVPEVWNEKMTKLLGLSTLGNDRNGCMQDVHWPSGGFGYFPSYTLGALIAAQLFWAAEKQMPGVRSQISNGDTERLNQWLKTNIWHQGSRFETEELLARATGQGLTVTPFIEHLRRRYLD
jgi:carboxypeptidase Taq